MISDTNASSLFDRDITRLIELGEEPRIIFDAIASTVARITDSSGAAVLTPSEIKKDQMEILGSSGNFEIEPYLNIDQILGKKNNNNSKRHATQIYSSGNYQYMDIICLGATVGCLALISPGQAGDTQLKNLSLLSHHASVAFKRFQILATYQHFVDRLQVINELNQLIASNAGLQRIAKVIAREGAYRFGADIALALITDQTNEDLEVMGAYGTVSKLLPKTISMASGVVSSVMKTGCYKAVNDLNSKTYNDIEFLGLMGIKSANLYRFDVRDESHGVMLIGYKNENVLAPNDVLRFEEFCYGAAVAIANIKTEEHIRAYSKHLEELVETRTSELEIQTQRAEAAIQAKSQFLANMSHELRTPLTAILGYTNVLLTGLFGEINTKQRTALTAVEQSSEQLKSLINDVLSLARIESGVETPEQSDISVNSILLETFNTMHDVASNKGVSLEPLTFDHKTSKLVISADVNHVEQILTNLLSNAIKYTPTGGKVWMNIDVVVDKIKIAIHDNGVGIAASKLENIFARCEIGAGKYNRNNRGTGLGLNLSKRLVELNGGIIGAESEEGKGSVFWVMFPIANSERKDQIRIQSNQTELSRLDGLSAVVVDDSMEMCEILKHILVASGASVRTALNVKNGLNLIRENAPDIILTDLAMPGENGLVLIDNVRNKLTKELSNIPIIVLSASAFSSDRKAVLSAGASLFIPKPFNPLEIVKGVRKLTFNMALSGR